MEIIGSAGPDSIRVSVSNGQLIISELLGNTVVGSFTGIGVERLRLTGEGAADTFLLVGALEQGGLKTLSIDTGAGADLVTTQLTAGNDDVTVVSAGSTTSVGWTGHYALTIGNTTTNDRLRIEALGGNDILNAAGVVAPVQWSRIDLVGGDGDDQIIGTPADDYIDSGLGNDRVSGMGGTDTFVDAGGTDEIIESFPSDFGLYGNLLVIGTLSSGNFVERDRRGHLGVRARDAHRLARRRGEHVPDRQRHRHRARQRHRPHRRARLARDRERHRPRRRRHVPRSRRPACAAAP